MSVNATQRLGAVRAGSNAVAEGSATANGTTYVELIASTAAPILITHVYRQVDGNSTIFERTVTLGTGLAGAEVGVLTVLITGTTAASDTLASIVPLPFPIRVPGSTRVAAKLSGTDASTTLGILYSLESAVV